MIQRGEDFAEVHTSLHDLSAEAIGRADHLACLHPTPGKERAAHLRPVVASGVLVDLGSASKFPPGHHGHILLHAALMQVLDQRAVGLIEEREMGQQLAVIIAVEVPASEVEGDAAGTRFHQSACDQEMFAVPGRAISIILRIPFAIALPDLRRLLAEVQGFHESAGGKDIERFLLEGIEAFHQAAGIHIAPEAIQSGEQRLAVGETLQRQPVEMEIFHAGAVGAEGGMGHAEESRMPGRPIGGMTGFGREPDEGGNGGIDCAGELGEHRPHGGPAARWLPCDRPPGVADERVMIAIRRAEHCADRHKLVHDLGTLGHVLGDFDAGDICADRLMRPSDLTGRVHLEVEHVLMRWRAHQVDHDHRLVRLADPLEVFSAEQLGQGQTAKGEAADLQEVSPRHPIA